MCPNFNIWPIAWDAVSHVIYQIPENNEPTEKFKYTNDEIKVRPRRCERRMNEEVEKRKEEYRMCEISGITGTQHKHALTRDMELEDVRIQKQNKKILKHRTHRTKLSAFLFRRFVRFISTSMRCSLLRCCRCRCRFSPSISLQHYTLWQNWSTAHSCHPAIATAKLL